MLNHSGKKIVQRPSTGSRSLKEIPWSETEFCSLSEQATCLAL